MLSVETDKTWEYVLRKYLLLLATVVATVTYAAGFNPPGGVWQDTDASHLAGDPIILETHHSRYMVFFCCNAIAFASSLVVIVLILLLALLHGSITVVPLRVVMVLDLLSIMGAYAAGTCRDTLATIYYSLLVTVVFAFPVVLTVLVSSPKAGTPAAVDETPAAVDETKAAVPVDKQVHKQVRKVLMLLATFMVSVTYMAGLSTPGGFWDSTQDGHHAGDAVLQELHPGRLRAFFVCNTTVFVASLLIIVLLLSNKLRNRVTVLHCELYGCIILALIGLVGAYASGSTREAHSTIYVGLLVGAVLACVLLVAIVVGCTTATQISKDRKEQNGNQGRSQRLWKAWASPLRLLAAKGGATAFGKPAPQLQPGAEPASPAPDGNEQALEKARSLVLLLATLAATVTYQAGLDPPGGFWQDDGYGHKAGDPILLTTNPRRYKVFFFCNSTAFVASLVAIILVERKFFHKSHMQLVALAAMILDLFGLIGAYAAGSCRDVSTSIYVIALAGAVLVYVVIHIVFFTLDYEDNKRERADLLEKRRKGLLLFAILGATITYQAGLTPPSGFWPQDDENLGHHAGDPVLFYNYPRRYKAFFYCNSASFMSSIALIILLVNPNLYMTAIRSYALSVCSVAGMFGLMGAYAAGSSQHMRTSIYVFVLVAVVLAFVISLLLISLGSQNNKGTGNTGDQSIGQGNEGDQAIGQGEDDHHTTAREQYTKRKYLMLLGILAASVTYQAGLEPPGGAWQGNSLGHTTGDPILRDKRRYRYRFFFYSNSTSFVASIVVIVLLLPEKLQGKGQHWLLQAMNITIVLDMLGLLGAYAAGSSRECETFWYVIALIITVLGYLAIYLVMSLLNKKKG